MARRVYFYCNAIGDEVRIDRSISTDSPAATRKIVGICAALRRVGVKATIISMGRGASGRDGRYHRSRACRLHGVPVAYGPMLHLPVLSQLLTLAWLVAMAVRKPVRRPNAVHLFYNQLSAYIPAMALLRLAGARTAIDIEDGHTRQASTIGRNRLGNASPALFPRLVSNGALLACSALAAHTGIRPVMPYYGAIPRRAGHIRDRRVDGAPSLQVLYSGFLSRETGANLLIEAVDLMRASGDQTFDALTINVAGMGPAMPDFRRLEEGRGPAVKVLGRLVDADYTRLLAASDIGLSLKLVGGDLDETTFPSKTVEYAENGLAIIATDISDVRLLFEESALYIERNAPEELVHHLAWAVRNPTERGSLAIAAQAVVHARLSMESAGERLAAFLFSGRQQ